MSGSRPHLHHSWFRCTQLRFCAAIVLWRSPGAERTDKHNVPRDEALSAMSHAHAIFPNFQATRGGFNRSPTLFIGPSRYGTLEVIAIVTPPADVHIFHVMALRESTRKSVDYEEGDQS